MLCYWMRVMWMVRLVNPPIIHNLPGGVKVAQRDWLSANHVLLQGESGRVIIDTGYVAHAEQTRACVEAAFGSFALDLVVNTHCHSDHMGCNAYLQRWTHAPIAIPVGERDAIASWDETELCLNYADQQCERFTPSLYLHAEETHAWGNLQWNAIAAPGHNDATLMFYNPTHRILLTADALWEHSFGFVPPRAWDAGALARARAALDTIAALKVDIVVPGHGAPFTDIRAALGRAYARLEALEASDERVARQIAKVMFVYSILARGAFPRADVAAFTQRVGILRDLNAQFMHWPVARFAQWLCDQALESGNVALHQDTLVAMATT
jgi:glyoxylase-like metal-dependent hydrolase (beta-lactamase superfamily II)